MASNQNPGTLPSSPAEERKMKIACLQFAPEVGQVQSNIMRADSILRETQLPPDLDWLVLPEMAFSGKNLVRVLGFFTSQELGNSILCSV